MNGRENKQGPEKPEETEVFSKHHLGGISEIQEQSFDFDGVVL